MKMKTGKRNREIPFEFILDELGDFVTDIKPMFGAWGLYHEHKILMILRKKQKPDVDTGMWLAVTDGCHAEIRKELPQLRDLMMFGPGPTSWQVLGEDLPDFEETALKICDLVLKEDRRIGRTPKTRLKAKKR
jgi:hypothetical protein